MVELRNETAHATRAALEAAAETAAAAAAHSDMVREAQVAMAADLNERNADQTQSVLLSIIDVQ